MPNRQMPAATGLIRRTESGTRAVTSLLGALLTVAAGFLGLSNVGTPLVTLSYDMPFIVHRAGGAENVRMVFLTELDHDTLDRRPQAALLDRLNEAGAKMVIYDLIFDAPSEDPTVDAAFADAIRRFRGVDANGEPVPNAPRRHVFLGCGRATSKDTAHNMETLVVPTDVLLDAADDFGLVAFVEDSFLIRRLITGNRDEPSLSWKAAQAAGAALDEDTRMAPRWMNFAGPPPGANDPEESVPIASCDARSVLSGGMDGDFFRNKIVIVGGRPGIVGQELGKDLFTTPFHRFPIEGKIPYMSGVEIQANAFANLFSGNWLTRSSQKSDTILVTLAGILIGAGIALLRPMNALIAATCVTLSSAAAGVVAVHYGNFWFPWTAVGFLQVPVALVWGIASNTYIERFFRIKLTVERQAIRAAFAKYLSPQMLDRLTAQGFHTDLGGETVMTAIMFTDLENFTDMCERVKNPKRIVETMNGYFERTTASIFEHDGVVIKFIGDAIFAAWGAPIEDPLAPDKAARAAWKLFESDKLVVDGYELRTRIGLHYGEVVAGNIGSSKRVDYTLIGDAVNLASRLEGINKVLGTHILMSAAVASHLSHDLRSRKIGTFRVKGRKEPVEIHELLGPPLEETEPTWITAYHTAITSLECGDFESALRAFSECDTLRGPNGDGPSRMFIEKIRTGDIKANGLVELKDK